MAVERSYARLGLFLVVALVVMLATTLLFIQRLRSREVIEMVTYTTENVSGLDISSPVRYRGVPIGRVSRHLRVDPVGSIIEIDFEVFRDRLGDHWRERHRSSSRLCRSGRVPQDAGPGDREPRHWRGVPAARRAGAILRRRWRSSSRRAVPTCRRCPRRSATVQDRLPAVLERAEATLRTLREIVARIPDSLDRSDRFFTNVERIFQESQLPALSADSRTFFATTSAQIEQLTSESGQAGRHRRDAGRVRRRDARRDQRLRTFRPRPGRRARRWTRTSLAADDLRRALPAIRDSLEQLRELARMLEEQPESVVYGPRPAKEPER